MIYKIRNLILVSVALYSCCSIKAQSIDSLIAANKTYFAYPLKTTNGLGGAFMEPRPGAYHMGVDFPAPMGTPVRAAADGYIWRLRISPYGYGRAVYIRHKNGLLTVYGHFSKFSDSLASYLTRYQYTLHANEVDIFPDSLLDIKINIKKGEVIGYVGNAGQSFAPHLHFEIREARGETYPLNPLLFSNFGLVDIRPPVISNIALYDGDVLKPQLQKAIYSQTILCHHTKVWLGVAATDYYNNGHAFGIYGYSLKVNGKEIYKREYKRLDFTYLANTEASTDYIELYKGVLECYRLHTLPMNDEDIQDGIIEISPNQNKVILIEVYDIFNNKRSITFTLKGAPALTPGKVYSPYNAPYTWAGKNAIIDFPAHCSYVSAHPMVIENEKGIVINDDFHHCQKKYKIKLFNTHLSAAQLSKTIVRIGHSTETGYFNKDTLIVESNAVGTIKLETDTTPPAITLFLDSHNEISWTIHPTLTGIKSYNIWIDNKWRICYYDAKIHKAVCDVGDLKFGYHEAKIEITDKLNNTLVKNFIYTGSVFKH